jgi:hypothetical protein
LTGIIIIIIDIARGVQLTIGLDADLDAAIAAVRHPLFTRELPAAVSPEE